MWVIRRLHEKGFEALLAGGCVRDMLLGIRPADYDVATSATPQAIRQLFPRVLMVGAQFGVAVVVRSGRMVEVATFRSDVSYTDGRRPDEVVFSNARADAERRDFTINGMFLDPITNEVVDYVGGQTDLQAHLVRAIGNPQHRFAEDYLRMLRAVRFAARLQFEIEPATADAIKQYAPNIQRISGERVREELEKMLSSPTSPRAMELVHQLGLAGPIFGPSLTEPDTWAAGMDRLGRVAKFRDAVLSLGAILIDSDPGEIRALTRTWGASNDMRSDLVWLAQYASLWENGLDLPLASLKRLLANPSWPRLRRLWRAEEQRVTGRDVLARRMSQRIAKIDPARINPPPFVGGEDLKLLGMVEGPEMGQVLRTLMELQLAEQINTREEALQRARGMLGL